MRVNNLVLIFQKKNYYTLKIKKNLKIIILYYFFDLYLVSEE